ncbi:MAG: hypothetical protein IIC84_09175, partial [Chloroflexi bacterium]|nr:hypothetical protein [Chloroflexota bacterium]
MKHRAFVLAAMASVLLLVIGACSSADEPEPTAVSQAVPTSAAAAPTTAPAPAAVPTLAPADAQQAAPILAASEIITQTAEALGVP